MRTEGLGEGGECDVAVPADVASAFEMVQPESVFEFAVVVLDTPSPGQAHAAYMPDAIWAVNR